MEMKQLTKLRSRTGYQNNISVSDFFKGEILDTRIAVAKLKNQVFNNLNIYSMRKQRFFK